MESPCPPERHHGHCHDGKYLANCRNTAYSSIPVFLTGVFFGFARAACPQWVEAASALLPFLEKLPATEGHTASTEFGEHAKKFFLQSLERDWRTEKLSSSEVQDFAAGAAGQGARGIRITTGP